MRKRGYFGVAIYQPKKTVNVGSLIRTTKILGGSFIAVIGKRCPIQNSDTTRSERHLPIFEYDSFEQFKASMPRDCALVGVELDNTARELRSFTHPPRAVYLLGAEDNGIPPAVLKQCNAVLKLEGDMSLNVAIAGSIVLYHRQSL